MKKLIALSFDTFFGCFKDVYVNASGLERISSESDSSLFLFLFSFHSKLVSCVVAEGGAERGLPFPR